MTKRWEFNKEVARNFDYIADTSIPKYRVIIHKTVRILNGLDRDSKIIDVGCATGNTLDVLKKRGFTNIYGVDNSSDMIDEAYKKGYVHLICSSTFPVKEAPFDVVIANWTLHFIEPKKREQYIKDIYASLNPGGWFILSEKIDDDEGDYHQFKKDNFLSESEIREKSRALKGILVPKDVLWYRDILNNVGFKPGDVIDHTYCFMTFVLRK